MTGVRIVLSLGLAGLMVCGSGRTLAQTATEAAPQEASSAPVGSDEHPVRVSGGVMAGLIQKMVRPDYSGASGAVVMMARIDRTGKVVDLKAMSGPEVLRDSATKAARQWTYKPYLLNGQPVTVLTTITVNFQR